MNARSKGARGERELASYLSSKGYPSRRGQQFAGSPDSPDVVSPDFPFHVEGKRVEKSAPLKWMQKATEDAGGDKPPIVFWRPNGGRWMAMLWADDLIEQMKKKETLNETISDQALPGATE